MKNTFRILMALLVVFFFTSSVNAQKTKTFQGTITYDITYTGANMTPAEKAQLPTTSTVTIKDCKTKTEMVTGPVTQAAITDGTTKTETVLIDYMGTKYALKLSATDISEGMAKVNIPKVEITQDTKVIAGFTCKKAILTTVLEDSSMIKDTIYYTEEIGCSDLNFSSTFKDVPGAILEYTEYIAQMEATSVYVAKEVKKSKISDNVFLIPSDYQEVTKEEFKKAFGGE
jgi:GLPGLI family protein